MQSAKDANSKEDRNRRNRHRNRKPNRQRKAPGPNRGSNAVSNAFDPEFSGFPTVSAKSTSENALKPEKPLDSAEHSAAPQSSGSKDPGSEKKNNFKKKPNRNRSQDRPQNRRGGEKGLYDPYEEPAAEELSLAEIRARIVLNATDPAATAVPTVAHPSAPAETESSSVPVLEITGDAAEAVCGADPLETPPTSEPTETVEIIGIRFRASGKTYYFDPQGITAEKGQFAIVETARGPEFGDVCIGNTRIRATDVVSPLRPVVRIATEQDITKNAENRKKEQDALVICREKIAAHRLEMKLVDAQYAFDGSKLLFYFTADGRVDFRELVKDLASVFRTRIELRQIGIRDEAKMLGGLGACGRALCCSTFLPDFAQVSIKMAKEQNLSLNSSKISGVCGRLMCCLRFESDTYNEEIRRTPAIDTPVKTEDGIGYVIGTNPLAGTVRVAFKDRPDIPPKQYHRSEVTVLEKKKHTDPAESDEK